MQSKLHSQKPGWYTQKYSAFGIYIQKECKADVLKLLSNHGSWLCQFFVNLVQKILQHQIRMPAVSLATQICFYCKLYLTYDG